MFVPTPMPAFMTVLDQRTLSLSSVPFLSTVTRWLLRIHWLELALHYAFLHPTAAACVCFARLHYVSGRFSLSLWQLQLWCESPPYSVG